KPIPVESNTSKPVVTLVYSRKPRESRNNVPVVLIVLWYLDSGCFKHITGDRSQLTNFVNKFLGMVKFGNDHVAKIMGYGDYMIGNLTISRVYFIEGLGHNLFFVRQFCDSDLKVAFHQHTCFIRNLEEAVATACYTQNRSIVRLRHGKTSYKLLHGKIPDLSLLHVFGALCYQTNDSENLGKRIIKTIHVDFDELTAMASKQSSSGPALHEMTPATSSSGLVPKPTSLTPFVPPSRNNWDPLFQPLFDELLTPPPSVDSPALAVIAPIAEVIAPEPAESTGSPSSTIVDQDAPSPIAHMGNDLFFGMPIPEVASDKSSSTDSIHTIVQAEEFVDPDDPNHVYKLKKALYGLKQAPCACQSKYALESLKKYGFKSCDPVDTPMVEKSKLDEDKEWKVVDPSHYHGMIGTLLYRGMVEKSKLDEDKEWKDLTYNLLYAYADHAGCQDTRRSTSGSL
nr:integrase, catalytic region, zinc finger, CCHC-type, peptidase aspartic, catalytic [Tanacetum cinerariifolium]